MEEFLLKWNVEFPADRWWRKKYNVSLFSEQHLEMNQIDITLEYLEDKIYEKYKSVAEEKRKKQENYKNGELFTLKKNLTETDEELIGKLKLSMFKKKPEND